MSVRDVVCTVSAVDGLSDFGAGWGARTAGLTSAETVEPASFLLSAATVLGFDD